MRDGILTPRNGGDTMNKIENIGARIRTARERRGWSQEQLAAASDVSARQLQRIEAGTSHPSGETLQALAGALQTDVSELRFGFTEQQIEDFRREYLCPHCRAPLSQRIAVDHEYGTDDVEVFECGFNRGMASRPCPADPRFPKFEDYELIFTWEVDRWWCHAIGRTEAARQVDLRTGCGTSQEEAKKWVNRNYIEARDGYAAAQAFLPL
jgi:transcriptional regulator with XRE-family HTH domain